MGEASLAGGQAGAVGCHLVGQPSRLVSKMQAVTMDSQEGRGPATWGGLPPTSWLDRLHIPPTRKTLPHPKPTIYGGLHSFRPPATRWCKWV